MSMTYDAYKAIEEQEKRFKSLPEPPKREDMVRIALGEPGWTFDSYDKFFPERIPIINLDFGRFMAGEKFDRKKRPSAKTYYVTYKNDEISKRQKEFLKWMKANCVWSDPYIEKMWQDAFRRFPESEPLKKNYAEWKKMTKQEYVPTAVEKKISKMPNHMSLEGYVIGADKYREITVMQESDMTLAPAGVDFHYFFNKMMESPWITKYSTTSKEELSISYSTAGEMDETIPFTKDLILSKRIVKALIPYLPKNSKIEIDTCREIGICAIVIDEKTTIFVKFRRADEH